MRVPYFFHDTSIDRGTRRTIDCNKPSARPAPQASTLRLQREYATVINHWLKRPIQHYSK
jgi:hypothetical protein